MLLFRTTTLRRSSCTVISWQAHCSARVSFMSSLRRLHSGANCSTARSAIGLDEMFNSHRSGKMPKSGNRFSLQSARLMICSGARMGSSSCKGFASEKARLLWATYRFRSSGIWNSSGGIVVRALLDRSMACGFESMIIDEIVAGNNVTRDKPPN